MVTSDGSGGKGNDDIDVIADSGVDGKGNGDVGCNGGGSVGSEQDLKCGSGVNYDHNKTIMRIRINIYEHIWSAVDLIFSCRVVDSLRGISL